MGVLVSHNTATDIQFLLSEYIRCDKQLPKQIVLGLDTLETIRRFASVQYRKVSVESWPEATSTGRPSMGVKPCATYALSQRNPPEQFKDVCGDHHDAVADTRAVAVILFDEKQFKQNSLYHTVFKSKKKCFFPLKKTWDKMLIKANEPTVKVESLPDGWIPAEVVLTHMIHPHPQLLHPSSQ